MSDTSKYSIGSKSLFVTANERLDNATKNLVASDISIDVDQMASIIQKLIKAASFKSFVCKDDIKVYTIGRGEVPKTVKDAIYYGTKFFDALYYFSLVENERPECIEHPAGIQKDTKRLAQTISDLLYCALFCMIRGSYPSQEGTTKGTVIPQFISIVLGFVRAPKTVAENLCSFTIEKVPIGWIKHIDWKQLSPLVQNRLGLGVAGYRAFAPFKYLTLKRTDDEIIVKAYEWVMKIVNKDLDWAIMSATRDPSIITRFGSLNESLGNMALECFSIDDLKKASDARIIYAVPSFNYRGDTWKSFANAKDLDLHDPIFPKN